MKQNVFEKLAGLNFSEYFDGLKIVDMHDEVVDNTLKSKFSNFFINLLEFFMKDKEKKYID